jgi:hypothetical protein
LRLDICIDEGQQDLRLVGNPSWRESRLRSLRKIVLVDKESFIFYSVIESEITHHLLRAYADEPLKRPVIHDGGHDASSLSRPS